MRVLLILCVVALTGFMLSGDATMAQYNSRIQPLQQTADLQQIWQTYQQRYITTRDAGDAPRQRVLNGHNSSTTYSEGQAYGLLIAAYLDDQPMFDALWLYAADHLNRNGLMAWLIEGSRIDDPGAATDADVDMAMALVVACDRVQNGTWDASSHGIDYCQAATDMIEAIWAREVDHPGPGPSAGLHDNPGYELLPGDSWCLSCDYPDGIVNLSYFPPGYFRVFAEFTGNDGWYNVIERNYEIAQQVQASSCAGFVSNWNTYDAAPQEVPWQGTSSRYWGWDAARFAWRLAVDAYWYNDARALESLQPIADFFGSVGMNNIRAEYRLNGSPVNSYSDVFFQVHAGAAIWAVDSPAPSNCGQAGGTVRSDADDAYRYILNNDRNTYYSDSWRLLGLMLLNGVITRPDLTVSNPPDTPTPAATEEPTLPPVPTVTPTADATATPAVSPTRPPIVRPNPTATQQQRPPGNNSAALQIATIDSGSRNEQHGHFRYQLRNTGQQTQHNIAVRLYFTPAPRPAADYVLETYFDSSNAAGVSEPVAVSETMYYFEIRYQAAGLAPGATWDFQGNIHLRDWQHDQTPSDDPWRSSPATSEYQPTDALPVFVNGNLVTGHIP
jgi:endo-1,4-beta-D-glucanase Y